MSFKDKVLNKFFMEKAMFYTHNFYYIIPTGDKSNVLVDTLDSIGQQNTRVSAEKNYVHVYSIDIKYCIAKLTTKTKIDLTNFTKLKYHFKQTRGNMWPASINISSDSGDGTKLKSFNESGEISGEIDISKYSGEYYIKLLPYANETYFYYVYLE